MATDLKTKYAGVLIRPRVTEKASYLQQGNVYAFEISPGSTKPAVAAAVKAFYNVTPLKVNIVQNPAKKVSFRGKSVSKKGLKKAYIYLKEGDKIEF